jgi:hypothetical protein
VGAVSQDHIIRPDPHDPVFSHQRRPVNPDKAVIGQLALGGTDRASMNHRPSVGAKLDIIAGGPNPVDLPRQQGNVGRAFGCSANARAEQRDYTGRCRQGRNPAPGFERDWVNAHLQRKAE